MQLFSDFCLAAMLVVSGFSVAGYLYPPSIFKIEVDDNYVISAVFKVVSLGALTWLLWPDVRTELIPLNKYIFFIAVPLSILWPLATYAFVWQMQKEAEEKYASPLLGGESGLSRAVRASISFTYCDSEGLTSTREVDIKLVGDSIFEGYCHKRRAFRTFRIDRIVGELVDLSTGELIEPDNFFAGL